MIWQIGFVISAVCLMLTIDSHFRPNNKKFFYSAGVFCIFFLALTIGTSILGESRGDSFSTWAVRKEMLAPIGAKGSQGTYLLRDAKNHTYYYQVHQDDPAAKPAVSSLAAGSSVVIIDETGTPRDTMVLSYIRQDKAPWIHLVLFIPPNSRYAFRIPPDTVVDIT